MNVSANLGYKQTALGLIPENWEYGPLERFWNILDCKHVTAEFFESGYPLVSIREVQSRFVDLSSPKFTSEYYYSLLIEGGRKPLSGDLILSRNATVGEVAQVTEWHPPFAMGQDVCLLRRKNPAYSTDYLQSLFRSSIIQNQINDAMVGSTFKRVNVEQIRGLIIPFPNIFEQTKIADSLQIMDALICSLDQLIAKKRDIQQAAMHQLLTGQRRLPDFSGEWKVKRLGDHLSFLRNGANSRAELTIEGDVRYLHYGDIHGSQHQHLNPAKTFMPCLPHEKAKRLDRLENGDLVFSDASEDLDGVGKSVEVQLLEDMELVSGLHTIAVRFNKNVMADGFKAYLQFIPAFRSHLRQLAAGTKVYATNRAHIASAELEIPEIEEQIAISTILSDMDTELSSLEARCDKARELKQGMMQELLTGRIRLV